MKSVLRSRLLGPSLTARHVEAFQVPAMALGPALRPVAGGSPGTPPGDPGNGAMLCAKSVALSAERYFIRNIAQEQVVSQTRGGPMRSRPEPGLSWR